MPRRSVFSPFHKLTDLRRRFTELTQDLLWNQRDADQDLSQRPIDPLEIDRAMKIHRDLEEKIARMIPQEVGEDLRAQLAEAAQENEMLLEKIHEMKGRIKNERKKTKELQTQLQDMDVEHKQKDDAIEDYKTKCEKHRTEVTILSGLLKDRNKELLSLERFVHKHERCENRSLQGMGILSLENRHLQSRLDGAIPPVMDQKFVRTVSGKTLLSARHQINPAFLGDGFYE
jgi:chromosome segregation ATPase